MVARGRLGLVERASTGLDYEGRTAVLAAPDEHIVDASERPIPVRRQRILRNECVPQLPHVGALPCVAVADAPSVQWLSAGPETHARRIRIGVEITCHNYVPRPIRGQAIESTSRFKRLQATLLLVIELKVGKVIGDPDPPYRRRRQNLGDKRGAGEVAGARCDAQIAFDDLAEWPAACRRDTLPVSLSSTLLGERKAVTENQPRLIDLFGENCLLQHDDVSSDPPITLTQDHQPTLPVATKAPDVVRCNTQIGHLPARTRLPALKSVFT